MNPKCPICRGIGWVCENHPDIGFRTGLRVQGRRALQVQQDRRHRRAGRHPAYRPGPAAAAPLAASGREAQLGHQAQRGGLNSPASQPTAAVIMGSTEIEICSVRSQVEHSNVRTTKPRSPGDIRASAIRCRHTGHIGLSFIGLIMTPCPRHRTQSALAVCKIDDSGPDFRRTARSSERPRRGGVDSVGLPDLARPA